MVSNLVFRFGHVNPPQVGFEVPEHPVLTRRKQFKVKASIKEEKQSKKGKGKGKGAGKGKGKKGKSCGKGKGRKGKKGATKESSKMKRTTLSSKRAILLNKRKSAEKGTKESSSIMPNTSIKLSKTQEPEVEEAAVKEHTHEPKKTKKPRSSAGKTAKNKAETRAKAGNKKAKAKQTKETGTSKRNNKNNKEEKKEKKEKNGSCKETGKGKGKGKGKADKKLAIGCTKDVKAVSDQVLQGRFKISDLEVGKDMVCPVIKSYLAEIMAECPGESGCDGSVHDLFMPEWDGLHFDMYYKRPAVGVRVRAHFVSEHSPQKADQNPKTALSIGYFSAGRCMGTNVAMAKIFAS